SIAGRRVAILLAAGTDAASVQSVHALLTARRAVPRLVAERLTVVDASGSPLTPDATFETMPSVLFDAVVIPDGAGEALASLGHAVEFVRDQYRHCKPILDLGTAK